MYRKVVLGWLCALALVLSPLALVKREAWAQQPGGANVGAGSSFNPTIINYLYGIPVTVTALSGCSTGGSPTVAGTQAAMLVTAGTTAATSCTITWPVTRSVAPNCLLTAHTGVAVTTPPAPLITVENTTTLTWTFNSVASSVWDVVCLGGTP